MPSSVLGIAFDAALLAVIMESYAIRVFTFISQNIGPLSI
jgi:hypothetical protein